MTKAYDDAARRAVYAADDARINAMDVGCEHCTERGPCLRHHVAPLHGRPVRAREAVASAPVLATVYSAAERIRGLEQELARVTHDLARSQAERDEARAAFRGMATAVDDARDAAYEDAATIASGAPSGAHPDRVANAIRERAAEVREGTAS